MSTAAAAMLLAMAVVLLVTTLCGVLAQRMGQARVVGEMVGGILLGPSALGRVAPQLARHLFPAGVLTSFDVLSTVGLVVYLFLIGVSLDVTHLRSQRRTALFTSAASILLPLALSGLLVRPLLQRFATAGVNRTAFALFLGVSLSITAFPVLARMLQERGLTTTPLGVAALLSAATDDVCAWLLLSIALSFSASGGIGVGVRLLLLLAYVSVMVFAVRPLVGWLAERTRRDSLSASAYLGVVAALLVSAAATDAIGVHPLFGAFAAGLCLPRRAAWQTATRQRLEPVAALLLPFFFALTGIRTRLDLLHGAGVWWWTAAITALAIVGKVGGAVIAARCTNEGWQTALALGALLNTRGLVELVVLNIALAAGVFTPVLFSMLVVMALVTTSMTLPLLKLLRVGHADVTA